MNHHHTNPERGPHSEGRGPRCFLITPSSVRCCFGLGQAVEFDRDNGHRRDFTLL